MLSDEIRPADVEDQTEVNNTVETEEQIEALLERVNNKIK